ncbi:unnamed protein product [Spirodela intermedia]|uniref:RING-type E3 ubiquitin transferase n=1 Tax=Spirodela intermedia TaxID=51605 RepID=A0A7I8IB50_SPIIN|nr:unnamed protein product [Spirodela intermedia]CAA6654966.1 unnamed protein product [Spirodela intermedia]
MQGRGFQHLQICPGESHAPHLLQQQHRIKGRFPYSDPEDRITGEPTAKSDVYALGIIVLQLLTGRPPSGLAAEVHQAVLGGTLSSILDQTAGDWPPMVASRLAQFGLCCSKTKARDRLELAPEVLRELEQLLAPEARPVPSFFLCPIRQVPLPAPSDFLSAAIFVAGL